VLDSAALGAARVVSVYRPPGHQGPLPGCVLADGGAARGLAHTLEPVILAGAVPPVLLVGVHNAFDPANPWRDRRAQEYLPGHLSPPLRRASALRHRRGPPLGHRPVGRGFTTIFVLEQNANVALSIADRGYALQTGQMVLADTAQALLNSPLMRKAYLAELICSAIGLSSWRNLRAGGMASASAVLRIVERIDSGCGVAHGGPDTPSCTAAARFGAGEREGGSSWLGVAAFQSHCSPSWRCSPP